MSNVHLTKEFSCLSKLQHTLSDERKYAIAYFQANKSIFEAGVKLKQKPCSTLTAAILYHRFFKECDVQDYDPFLIAATAIYLGGKVEEDHTKIRDVINVFYRILHPNKEPLSLGEEYWSLRDSVVHCELLMLRMLAFKVAVNGPQKYLMHYLKSLYDWLGTEVTTKFPLAQTCWKLLCDAHLSSSLCLQYPSPHLAAGVIQFALQIYGLEIPFSNSASFTWYEAFSEDLTMEKLGEIVDGLLQVYEDEEKLGSTKTLG